MRPKSIWTAAGLAVLLGCCLAAHGQGFTTQHTFTGPPEGAGPQQLVWTNGLFYGSTSGGGTNGMGSLFSFNTNGQVLATFYSFAGPPNDGTSPNNVLVVGNTIYGTAQGGTNYYGMIYRVGTDGGGFTQIYGFGFSPDGQSPQGGLVLSGATLYGTTYSGGSGGGGTIFKINTNGTGYTTLHSFTNKPDGAEPQGTLVLAGNLLYGTTTYGGTNGYGAVFSINTNGNGYAIVHSFTNTPELAYPYSGLVLSAGVLYGNATSGGASTNGGIFALGTNGSGYATLYSFSALTGNTDGRLPESALSLSGNCLYGTTTTAGSATGGTLFLINTNGTGFTILKSFTNGADSGWDSTGGALRVGNSVWGTTSQGGNGTYGTIFRLLMPAIISQPQSVTVTSNNPATFTINAADDSQISYQWYLNTNTLLTGQTTNVLALAHATNNGTYTVVLSDSFASVTSSPAVLTIVVPGTPPTVTSQPQNYTTLANSSASFTNAASGTPPLYFQWYFNTNTFLGGQTNAILVIPSASPMQQGYYSVVVSNVYGMATSAPAFLTVISPVKPTITNQPQSITVTNGYAASFTNGASGTAPLYYRWFFNTNTLVNSGVNDTIYTLSPATTNQAGYYTVIVTNLYGGATSAPALLTVIPVSGPAIASPPQSITVSNGFAASFTNLASGTGPLFYRWYFNTNTLVSSGVDDTVYTISSATTNQAGYYTVIVTNLYGGATSPPALLTVLLPTKPSITLNPSDYSVTNGYDASFTNTASGTGPLAYQWYFNTNTAVAGGTNAILVVSFAATNDAGYYQVIVTNVAGSATSSPARLSVISTKPIIFVQPQDLAVTNGQPFSFTVVAAGLAPLRYQWYTNKVFPTYLQTGKTNSTASYPSATNKFTGNYLVVITNALGRATSDVAALTIPTIPVITLQPTNLMALTGSSATFTATAVGTGLLKYQWFFQTNSPVGAATNPTLTLNNVDGTVAGYYSLRVTNSFGAVTSSYALLIVSNAVGGSNQLVSFSFDRASGSFSLVLSNSPNSVNYVWATTNLALTNLWLPIATNTMGASGLWDFTDPNTARTNNTRFYRFSSQ